MFKSPTLNHDDYVELNFISERKIVAPNTTFFTCAKCSMDKVSVNFVRRFT